ncbi:MAG: hypothetical protein OXJ62_08770 [Spirochaetaceae bacterium]|nr:hypothetical protein [Spirochaetaceae bacterium]
MNRDAYLDAVAGLVRGLHATPQQAVIEVAGGTLALSWLHAVPGSSRTVLEATDRYCRASLADLLGAVPESVVSSDAAIAMAAAALRRARVLAGPETPVLGAACTAALATDRGRRGADRAYVAVADAFGTVVSKLTFAALANAGGKNEPAGAADPAERGADSRQAAVRQRQEAAASAMLVAGLASACGVDAGGVAERFAAAPGADVRREFYPSESFAALESGRCRRVMLNAAAQVVTTPVDWRGKALLSGSYHPLHGGHLALGKAAASFLGREVVYELPLANADKAPIPLSEAQRRAAQFAARAPLVLTRAALFADKAALFPGAVFVVGADTAERLVDTRFYGGSVRNMGAALAALAERGCRLLVAGRRGGGRFLTLRHLAPRIPAAHRGLFLELPEARFRRDISSTEVRSRRAAARPACR